MCYDSNRGKGVTLCKHKKLQGMFLSSKDAVFLAVADPKGLNQNQSHKLEQVAISWGQRKEMITRSEDKLGQRLWKENLFSVFFLETLCGLFRNVWATGSRKWMVSVPKVGTAQTYLRLHEIKTDLHNATRASWHYAISSIKSWC